MFQPPERYFSVPKPTQSTSEGWGEPIIKAKPELEADENKKKAFGIELAKNPNNAFDCACNVCGEDTASAVYISLNWLNDPIVVAAKDLYLKTVEVNTPLLDKDQFAARLLQISEEKDLETGKYLILAKDRLGALELYAKVMGYTDNQENSAKTFIHNEMIVRFVEPDKKSVPTIEHHSEEIQDNIVPLKLKLVG